MRRLLGACVVAAGVLGVPSVSGVARPLDPIAAVTVRVPQPRSVEHRYRLVGKVRILLFWMGADDVGGARVTWSARDGAQNVSLIIGSDPRRAPRAVNEWGYVREEASGDSMKVFGIRTVTDGASPEEVEARRAAPGRPAQFGVLCSTIGTTNCDSRTATVFAAPDATYRHVEGVLDIVERKASWNRWHLARPPGVAPGFLTALDQMLRSTAASAGRVDTVRDTPRVSYVYKNAVYDLSARRVERVPRLRTRNGEFQDLLRTEFTVRSRTSGSSTGFVIVYGTEGALAGVPVHARYQPNWWFRVEIELDDTVDVPADPAAEASLLRRIEAVCASAMAE